MAPNLLGSSALLLAEVTQEPAKGAQDVKQTVTAATCATKAAKTAAAAAHDEYAWKIVWRNVIGFIYLHVGAVYGVYLVFTSAKLATLAWGIFVGLLAALGVTAGAHRLWAHRSYKATWQLRLFLITLQTIAFQNHVYEWVRDHRVHHKFTDTDADPHNSRRGFFFSHMGWLMVRKHPDVRAKGRVVDLSDLDKDPLVVWQRRLYLVLMPLLCFVMPACVPYYCWGERPWNSWYVASVFRYVLSLHLTWLVNSYAHMFGTRPYDQTISPTESLTVGILAIGEGWHNYHHVFPWDYKAAELPTYGMNMTLGFINQMAKIGWAYDLKTVPHDMIMQRVQRTGDGSHASQAPDNMCWGWGDADMDQQDVGLCRILHKKAD